MKRFFAIFPLLAFCSIYTCLAQADSSDTTTTKGPVITWESTTHDFGNLKQGDRVEKTFAFTNTGNEPLIITNVAVTCGCTTPKGWPKDPIPPNGKSEITIAFNSAGKRGKQNKVITIISNAVGGGRSKVSFTAYIEEGM